MMKIPDEVSALTKFESDRSNFQSFLFYFLFFHSFWAKQSLFAKCISPPKDLNIRKKI